MQTILYYQNLTTNYDGRCCALHKKWASFGGTSIPRARNLSAFLAASNLNFPAKRRRNDYDRYIELPNNTAITSSLKWWYSNQECYPDLARMARDVLAVPTSGCAVEREFSISGRIASWQRCRLSAATISNSMMYKASLGRTRCPMRGHVVVEDDDTLPVPEHNGSIPKEWTEKWWLEKLKRQMRPEILAMFQTIDDKSDEE